MATGCLLFALLALAVPPERAIAPLGPGHPAVGSRVDLVVRGPADLRAREPATLKLLLSDAATDAPVQSAKISVELFGPAGLPPLRGDATGSAPGSYLFSTTFPGAGRFALAATVGRAGDSDLLAAGGLDVGPIGSPRAPPRSPVWPFALGVVAALLLFAALRSLRRPAAAAMLLLLAGDARGHGAFTPPPATVPGAEVYLSQEVQFELGLRTAPAMVEAFQPPAGNGGAARAFIGVPRSAVVERDGHKLIFVRVEPERFVAREPKLGWSRADDEPGAATRVAVLDGLELDEKVVVEGAAFLRNGGAQAPAGSGSR